MLKYCLDMLASLGPSREKHYREIIDIVDNKLKLSDSVDIVEADVYMYPYLPIYIDCNVNL